MTESERHDDELRMYAVEFRNRASACTTHPTAQRLRTLYLNLADDLEALRRNQPTHLERQRAATESLHHALSRIDYACGEPNDMNLSNYDLHGDPTQVVHAVERALRTRTTKRT